MVEEKIIVRKSDVKGEVRNGLYVEFNGETFLVIEAEYEDEIGDGVLLQVVMSARFKDLIPSTGSPTN